MSFSAETIFEPPNKLPRLSISIGGGGGHRHPYPHYHHIALSCIHHRDVSVALLTNDAGDCCDDGHFQYPSSLLVVESEKGICIKSNVSAEINSIRRKSSSNGSVPNIIVKDDAFSSSSSSSSSKSSSYSSSSSILCQTLNPPALPPPQPPPLHLATLQPHLWPQLPQEIVEHILAFLPIHALFRFSTVCTSWRALVLSRAFMQTRILLQASSSLSSSALRHHHHHHLCDEFRHRQISANPNSSLPTLQGNTGLLAMLSGGGRRSRNPVRVLIAWFKRQPPKVKSFLAVFAAIFSLVFIRFVVRDHDNLFVAAEAIHSIGIVVLIYKLMKEKTCAGMWFSFIHIS